MAKLTLGKLTRDPLPVVPMLALPPYTKRALLKKAEASCFKGQQHRRQPQELVSVFVFWNACALLDFGNADAFYLNRILIVMCP
jgi:hypothetical protein